MKKKKEEEDEEEETHQESFQREIRVRCRERKKEKEVDNKSQEEWASGIARKKRQRRERVGHANTKFPEKRMEEQRQGEEKNGGAGVRENETLKILIKIKMLGGSFRKSAQLLKAAHSDQPPR